MESDGRRPDLIGSGGHTAERARIANRSDTQCSDEKGENVPRAGRTLSALRNLGYSFNSAVADLIDNSIAAGAYDTITTA